MPYSAKRIQVLLRQTVLDKVEEFADEQGLPNSKACALLIEEALRARGKLIDPASHLPPEVQAGIQKEATAAENGWTPSMGVDAMKDFLPKGAVVETIAKKAEPLASDDAQMLKLKLMQELMDQLKSM